MSNHYHFVALSPADPAHLRKMIRHLHSLTARDVNQLDETPDRQVWHQYWDTHLTYRNSYYARLNYVHQNPVHHQVVSIATAYPWCSAEWFERNADPAFQKVIASFKTDRVSVHDNFDL